MATILPSNFTSNSLSGSFTVENGLANVTLLTVPYALEGDKPFVIKIRRNSITGDVIATSPPIVLRDTSSIVSLTANTASVSEGSIVSFTLVTANAANNANLYYSVFPVTANLTVSDFYNSNVGVATLVNNQATFSLYANTDAGFVNEDGENFKVQLRTNSVTGNIVYSTANIEILDYYKLATITGISITSNVVVLQGANVIFSVSTFNGNNASLSYSTEGNVDATNFIGGNTGSFVANATGGFIVLQSNTNIPFNEVRQFRLKVNQSGQTATFSSNVIIVGPVSSIEATGGTITNDGNYRVHTFTTSANLNITSVSVTPSRNTMNYLVVGGGGGAGSGSGTFYAGGGGGGAAAATGNITASMILLPITITVGAGGSAATAAVPTASTDGSNSSIFTSSGETARGVAGKKGTSGGGGLGGFSGNGNAYGPSYQNNGYGSSGGGSGGAGFAFDHPTNEGQGGIGTLYSDFTKFGTNVTNSIAPLTEKGYFGGGGGAGNWYARGSRAGGYGGGGNSISDQPGLPGLAATGGGGGGGDGGNKDGGAGGSGVVIIRYQYQNTI
jgi:hypothetical protein